MKKLLQEMYIKALQLNDANVREALKITGPHKKILDVGCWDGQNTLLWASSAKAEEIYGIEPVRSAAREARKKNIKVFETSADRSKWPIRDESIDCIVSNQVIEHLSNVDNYFKEANRVLNPGGFLITSTNNLSSWHNIFALLMGWSPFDLTNSSIKTKGVGNPFAVHRGEIDDRGGSWTHKCIYTAYWLSEWQKVYNFDRVRILGSGYYPLPARIGKIFPRHSAFITVIGKKKVEAIPR